MNLSESPINDTSAEVPKDSLFSLVIKLVIIPLFIVALAVGVFVLFGWLAYDRRSPEEFLADIKTAAPSKKWQAAFVLAGKLRDKNQIGNTERLFQGMSSILTDKAGYDERVRSYVAMALGNLGDRRAIPLLENVARTETGTDVSIYSLWALGSLHAGESIRLLIEMAGNQDTAIRKTALFILGSLGSSDAIPVLKMALEDVEADIRWNAAFALAKLGDAGGLALIASLLDRGYYADFSEMSFQAQSDTMVNALLSIAYLREDSLLPVVEKLSQEDTSLEVRQTANKVLNSLSWDR